jgi:hypothetical protein
VVPQEALSAVLGAYDNALTRVFLVSAIMAAIGVLPALAMEKSVKKDKLKKGEENGADVERLLLKRLRARSFRGGGGCTNLVLYCAVN